MLTIITTSLLMPINIQKVVSEFDPDIPQSQTADNPVAPRGKAAQPSRASLRVWTLIANVTSESTDNPYSPAHFVPFIYTRLCVG